MRGAFAREPPWNFAYIGPQFWGLEYGSSASESSICLTPRFRALTHGQLTKIKNKRTRTIAETTIPHIFSPPLKLTILRKEQKPSGLLLLLK